MLRLLRQVSLNQFRASWGRAGLVVGGIATGVSLIVAINVLNTSVLAAFRGTIESVAGAAALQVTLGLGEVGFDEGAVDIVRADPDVAAEFGFEEVEYCEEDDDCEEDDCEEDDWQDDDESGDEEGI